MTYAAGALSQVSVTSTTAQLASAAATGGTGPYTYQWYKSTTTGFTPGAGNIISGATSLNLNDSGLIPNTTYYYKVIATDTGNANATATSSQLAVTTPAATLDQNAFAQSMLAGVVDQKVGPTNVVSVMIDASQATAVYPGQAVKLVDSAGGPPKVVACAANSDDVYGFINYDFRSQSFSAGQSCEVSLRGTCIYLYATTSVARGGLVQLDVTAPACVAAKTGSSGAAVVGYAYDQAAVGSLVRIMLEPAGVLGAVKA